MRLVNVNFALSPSLYAGQVDAVIGAFRNFELNQMDIDGRVPDGAFYPEDHGVPTYEELIFVAHPEYAKTVKVRRFLDVIDQATQLILQSPDTMYRSFVSYRPEDLDNELNRRAWRDTIPRLAPETRQTDAAQWERFAQFMEDRGLIQKPTKNRDLSLSVRSSMNEVFYVLAPVFVLGLIGYSATRFRFFTSSHRDGLSKYVFDFAVPILLFSTVVELDQPVVSATALFASYYIPLSAVFVLGLLISWLFLKRPVIESMVIGLGSCHSNAVLLGIPIIPRALGDEAFFPLFY